MPNFNIYISSAVVEDFKQEENKSGLVNSLLAQHYNQAHINSPHGHTLVKPKKAVEELKKLPQIKTADEIAIDAFAGKQLTCPAGHPSRDGRHCNNLKCAYGG